MSEELQPLGCYVNRETSELLRWLRDHRGMTVTEVVRRGVSLVHYHEKKAWLDAQAAPKGETPP